MKKSKPLKFLTAQEKADHQVGLSFAWAAKDYIKFLYFSEKLRASGHQDFADQIEKIAEIKKQRAFGDLEYLLCKADPKFISWDKAQRGGCPDPVVSDKQMVCSVMHSELDQFAYLYPEIARKLKDNHDPLADSYEQFSQITKDNFRNLQKLFAKRLTDLEE